MRSILILHFSGAGATRFVAEEMGRALENLASVQVLPFEEATGSEPEAYDALIVGTPVYHAQPAKLVMDYFEKLEPLREPKYAFVYNTRGLWSCNTNRILAKGLAEKNIGTILDRDYRSPASDGSLIVPFVSRFFAFERGIKERIAADCRRFLTLLEGERVRAYLPHPRVSAILNGPNKLAGQLITFPIHLHRDRCSRCGHCVEQCPHQAWERDGEGYPVFVRSKCENCYRCIHHCPQTALSLSKRRAPGKVLYR